MPNVKVRFEGGMRFVGECEGGNVIMDAPTQAGGTGGPTPMNVLLAALGGCTGMDVISILRKKRAEVTGFEMNIEGQRAAEHPKKYTGINIEFVLKGKGLKKEDVERAIELSMDKYCSVKATIEGGASKVSHSYRIEE
ncbi:MAG: OsmC family protein [Actinomycetota bacterium]|nr:OsmC family protein [Actinomycetota bacterium]